MLDIIITLAQAFRAQQKQLYIVGGTVRDVLLHRGQSNDADLATDAAAVLADMPQPAAAAATGQWSLSE